MKIRFALVSILISVFLFPIKAQKVYNLSDCIHIALEKNFAILVARNKAEIASNNYTKGNAGYLPSVDLSSRYGGSLNNSMQNLTDGTQINTQGTHNRAFTNSVNLGLTIFDGFSVKTSYQKLDELKQLGGLNTQLAVENLVADIISSYYNYIRQVQMLINMKYAVALSKERLRIDEERYLLGSNSKLQVLQSRVYLNSDSSYLSRQYEVVRNAQISLNELMAKEDLGEQFESYDTSIVVNAALLYEKLLDETMQSNTSLQIASKNKTISEYDYKLIQSQSYPYLSLSTGYGYNLNYYSNSTTKNQRTNGLNYGVSLGLNVFDGYNQRRNLTNSNIEIMNKELLYLEVEQSVKADLLTIYHAYSNNLRLIQLEEQNLETATENLDIALARYKLGNLSGIELREVQKSLLDAKESLLSIQYQTKLAEISLELISGKIMDYYQ